MKRALAIMTGVALAITLIVSCGAKTGGTASAKAPKDHMEISFAMWGIGEALADGAKDPIRDTVYQKLNITIKPMNTTWDDYTQKIQVWAASGQLPDIFAIDAIGTANYKKWIDEGIVRALPADLTPYPQMAKLMSSPGFDMYKYPMGDPKGKIYAIPRLNHRSIDDWSTDTGVHLRKDWMQNVGVTAEPTTMDELISLMKAFVEKDPDKNGKKDTIGLTMYSASWLTWFFLAYEPGIQSGGWVRDANNPGKWIPAFMTKGTLEGMKALKKLYDAGGMDRDFATLKAEAGRDKFAAGRAGAYVHDVTPSTMDYVAMQFEKNFPDKKYQDVVTILKPFKNADGNYYRNIANPAWSETYLNAKVDDKKAARIIQMFEYFMGDEGWNLLHLGIEGKDYKVESGKIVRTPQKDSAGKEIAMTTLYPFLLMNYAAEWSGTHQFTTPAFTPALQKMSSDLNDWLQANAKPVPTDLRINLLDVPDKDKAVENIGDDIIKCVLSKDVEKTWNEIVKGYRANGYDKLIDEINAECAKIGIK
jgi:putative aldouronate transport system substrate-binding protein